MFATTWVEDYTGILWEEADPAARRLTRDEVSLGEIMILKGHASLWSAAPIDWCAA